MSDPEFEARHRRIQRSIAREIATGVDNPVVAELRKMRREMFRECGYDTKKYARYISEQAEAFEREWGLNLKQLNRAASRSRAAQAPPAKMVAQKGGKGA